MGGERREAGSYLPDVKVVYLLCALHADHHPADLGYVYAARGLLQQYVRRLFKELPRAPQDQDAD